ncbi:MAG: YciI family protein [Nibricoccus sp.]
MQTAPTSSSAPYMLLFRNTGPEVFSNLSPEQRQQLITRWNAWFDGLLAQGKAFEGQPLEMRTRVVSGAGGARITDGPFPEAKEAIGGYVKLLVSSFDEATEIAQRHPALAHGMLIEVRELTPDCHLGVNTKPAALGMPATATY